VPLLLVALGAGLLRTWLLTPSSESPREAFVPVLARQARGGRTALRGFTEDFTAWRATLTPEERKLQRVQAANEYEKKFRKSEDYTKTISEEKSEAFNEVVKKFLSTWDGKDDNPLRDSKRDEQFFQKQVDRSTFKFGLEPKIVEIDRDADRRWYFSKLRIEQAKQKGEYFPPSSPRIEHWEVQNNDTTSHERLLSMIGDFKKMLADPSTPAQAKPHLEYWVEKGVPEMGKPLFLPLPAALTEQLHIMSGALNRTLFDHFAETNPSEEEKERIMEEIVRPGWSEFVGWAEEKYRGARDEIEGNVEVMKNLFKTAKDRPGKTKADIFKEIWHEMHKYRGVPEPEIDEDVLEVMSQYPAVRQNELDHPWGKADKLWKSEAWDPFGERYLLGIFETKEEALTAFNEWNAEYEEAFAKVMEKNKEWTRLQNAQLDKDAASHQRVFASIKTAMAEQAAMK